MTKLKFTVIDEDGESVFEFDTDYEGLEEILETLEEACKKIGATAPPVDFAENSKNVTITLR